MKKAIIFGTVLSIIISLCGCGNNNTVSDSQEIIYEEITINNTVSGEENTSREDTDSSNEEVSSEHTQSDVSGDNSSEVTQDKIVIDYETTVEIDICDDIIRGYMDATDPRQQYTFLSQYDTVKLDHQVLPVKWKNDGSVSYTLHISENKDFSNAEIMKISGSLDGDYVVGGKIDLTLTPGKTYYWKVYGANPDAPRGGGKILVKDQPVRWIRIDGVDNVRDIGGWKTEDGKTVNYGKIYRGGRLDSIKDAGIETVKKLGIKTDIDIRSTESWDTHGEVQRVGLNYYFIDTNAHYDYIFRGDGKPVEEVRTNYPKIFEILADESNYPIYLHCNFGNDRTGTMAYILNGLLGVSYEDLTRDYELTSYAFTHDRRWRGNGDGGTFGPNDLIQQNISNSNVDGRWGMQNKAFMESKYCTDGKLSTAIENFLLDAGVKQQHIDAYKKIMLE